MQLDTSLALIFYLAKTLGTGQCPTAIDEQSARQAIQWCEYLETHARRLYASGENPSMESARALYERIQKGDLPHEFSPRDVYYAKHWSKLDTVEKVNDAIKILKEFGWVKTEEVKTLGRSTIKVIVYPQLRGLR